MSENGQLIKEVRVLGKVSSLNSYLTPMEDIQIIKHDGGEYTAETPAVSQVADLDGTYGEKRTRYFFGLHPMEYIRSGVDYIFVAVRECPLQQSHC